jgi:DNA-binding NtrC family response regulator
LIHGEPGTGKNVLASAIHNLSPNREGPYVIFACGSIPNELILTELLGFDQAFGSKPVGNRPSKFELAEGGTLFFQDVDLLPLEAQVILLNVLEMGVVQRLGSNRTIAVDCRIIASTSADPKTLLTQKNFRSDLYFRLSVFSITIPPLRERPQDIPEIVSRFINRFSYRIGFKVTLGSGVMEVLKRYSWPGNVREIEALIGKTAMQVGQDGVIQINDLPSSILMESPTTFQEEGDFQVNTLEELEKQTILQTVKLCHGNVSRVAEILGISRTTLWRKLKTYQIDLEIELGGVKNARPISEPE